MANQMKVLVPLTASQGASVSNGFNVASGAATIAGVQIATVTDVTGALAPYATLAGVSASFTSHAELTSALAPYATQADVTGALAPYATAAAISASFVDNAELTSALAPYATLSGVSASFTTPAQVSGALVPYLTISDASASFVQPSAVTSALAPYATLAGVSASFATPAQVTSALAPYSTTADISASFVQPSQVTSALAPYATLAGVSASFATPAQVTSALAPYALSADVSASFATLSGVSASFVAKDGSGNVVITGNETVSGAIFFNSNTVVGQNGSIINTGLNNLTSSIQNLYNAIQNNAGASVQSVQNAYSSVRFAMKSTFMGNADNTAIITLSDTNGIGMSNIQVSDSGSVRIVTGSAVAGLSGSSESDCLDAIGYASFDVATKASGSTKWTNDLVALEIGAVQVSGMWYPQYRIDAPGLGNGNGSNQYRLLVSNEKYGSYVVSGGGGGGGSNIFFYLTPISISGSAFIDASNNGSSVEFSIPFTDWQNTFNNYQAGNNGTTLSGSGKVDATGQWLRVRSEYGTGSFTEILGSEDIVITMTTGSNTVVYGNM